MRKLISLVVLNVFFISLVNGQGKTQAGQLNFTSFTSEKVKITKELELLTATEYKSHPEYGVLPFNAPCKDCFEELQKRDEKHRYFVKEGTNGSEFYSQTSYNNLNYYDAGQRLRTIDYRLRPTAEAGVFKADRQPYPVTVNMRDKYVSVFNGTKEIQVNRNMSISIKNTDGTFTSMGNPSWSNYTAGDDGVVVHNFYPGIDLELHLGNGKVESFYRINKPLNLNGASMVIHDNIQLPASLLYDYTYTEKQPNGLYEGSLMINSGTGKHYYMMGSPIAFDENGSGKDYEISLQYGIDKSNGLDLHVPISWMNNPGRSYPILIDPMFAVKDSIPAATITSGYNATCFAGGCQYNLSLPVAAGDSIYDILSSFDYQVFSPCGLSQGAWDLTSGACRFPASGTFNTCNINIPGRCQLNLSCIATLGSCIPVRKCSSYTMPFQLTFYRCVQPAAGGCNGGFSCVIADPNTPWVMTIKGFNMSVRTSNISICQGASGNLTAVADSGMGPYTYLWSSGQSGATISVSPGSTVTYTVVASTCGGAATATATATVTVGPISASNMSSDTTICAGDSVQLHVSGGSSYLWSPSGGLNNPGSATPIATPSSTTTYTVIVTGGAGCTASAEVTITVSTGGGGPPPTFSVKPDSSYTVIAGSTLTFDVHAVSYAPGDSVYLDVSSVLLNGSYKAEISGPDKGIDGVLRNFKFETSCDDAISSSYQVTFTTTGSRIAGCNGTTNASVSTSIKVISPASALLDSFPNIFTPNGDHKNDSLSLYHMTPALLNCWTNFHIQIYNRYGQIQFESTDFNFKWGGNNESGSKVSEGVYYYIVTADFLGKAVTPKKGTVNVKM